MKRTIAAMAVCASLLAAVLGATVANADPSGSPTFRQLSGVGSDTVQGVMDGLSNTTTIAGTKVIGSYDAVGTANITTKDPTVNPNCTIPRPNGSNAGRAALLNSLPGSRISRSPSMRSPTRSRPPVRSRASSR